MGGKSNGCRMFKNAAELRKACDKYFDERDQKGDLYSEPGLILSLGIAEDTWDNWWEGRNCPDLQGEVRRACLRISDQIWTHPAYREKGGMSTRAIFLLKQKRLGGLTDQIQAKQDMTLHVKYGSGVDESDFK